MKYTVCFILGGPGAGKGTVCAKIAKDFHFHHLSAGDLLRKARDTPGNQYAELIQSHIKAGSIVPVKITCSLLHEAMNNYYQTSQSTKFLVDGFPRDQQNLDGWNEAMTDVADVKRILFLTCPDEICVKRCLNRQTGRVDDNEATLKHRIKQFKEDGLPVIQHYEALGLVSKIDASVPIDKVFEQVDSVMKTIS